MLRERKKERGKTYATMGQDIVRLTRRVYKGAPELADMEGKDYFIWALPDKLRVAVAAVYTTTVNECIDLFNWVCVILDTDEESSHSKRVRIVRRGNVKKKNDQKNQSSDKKDPKTTERCWEGISVQNILHSNPRRILEQKNPPHLRNPQWEMTMGPSNQVDYGPRDKFE